MPMEIPLQTGVVTTCIVFDADGSFWLMKRGSSARDEWGKWDLCVGGLDKGWTAEANVKRELEEELTLGSADIRFIGYRDVFRVNDDAAQSHHVALDFMTAVISRDLVRIGEPDKFDGGGWFTLGSLPSPPHSSLLAYLSKYDSLIRGRQK